MAIEWRGRQGVFLENPLLYDFWLLMRMICIFPSSFSRVICLRKGFFRGGAPAAGEARCWLRTPGAQRTSMCMQTSPKPVPLPFPLICICCSCCCCCYCCWWEKLFAFSPSRESFLIATPKKGLILLYFHSHKHTHIEEKNTNGFGPETVKNLKNFRLWNRIRM